MERMAVASKYRVQYRKGTDAWTSRSSVTSASDSLPFADLDCATAYGMRVQADGNGGVYPWSWGSPTTPTILTTPACPE